MLAWVTERPIEPGVQRPSGGEKNPEPRVRREPSAGWGWTTLELSLLTSPHPEDLPSAAAPDGYPIGGTRDVSSGRSCGSQVECSGRRLPTLEIWGRMRHSLCTAGSRLKTAVTVQLAGAPRRSGHLSHYLAPAALMTLLAAVIGVVITIPGRSGAHHEGARLSHAAVHRLPPYWFVRSGNTLSEISVKTRLTVAQLEAFNPQLDPNALLPGERLNLWAHPPVPRPPPPGPMFWTVRPGDSFGSIAAKSGVNIVKLEELNPQLKPATLQPGDQLRLRASPSGSRK